MSAPRPLTELLAEAEARLADLGDGCASGGDPSGESDHRAARAALAAALRAVEAAAERRPEEARPLAARIDALRALCALRLRELAPEALDGLYDDVRSGVTADPFAAGGAWRRAGMSDAFLDAPRSLLVWRRTALAACLLLAVVTGFQVGGARWNEAPEDDGVRPMRLIDPADEAAEGLDGGPFGRRAPTFRAAPRGVRASDASRDEDVHLFGTARPAEADARRMLDRIQIFPVPARESGAVEHN